ncbi:hypothetical protein CRE_16023 [Caenorhabditis remanei]|uniref:Major facilitator superfamily (MFS) profile domain-containing protein n=1 Tax=Caenorhabditis remanei TaxID=31234 RepID=E3MBD7_CAERE|nr:hypothetical protein CRE_16023 [Caenorhabditis remanei]
MSQQPTDGPLDPEKQELSIAVTAAEDFEEKVEEVGKVPPPDGGYGWVIVVASFLVNMCVDGVIYTFPATLIPHWTKMFGAETSASNTVSLLTGFYYLSGPLASSLVAVFDVRSVCMAGGILTASAFIACSTLSEAYQYYLLFGIVGGIGFGCMYLPSIVVLSSYFEKKRSFATGIAVCGSGIGTMLFSRLNIKVMGLLNDNASHFLFYMAGIILFGVVSALFFRKLKPSEQQVTKVAKMVREYEGKPDEPSQRLLEDVRADLEELNRPGHNPDAFYVNTLDKKIAEAAHAEHVIHASENHTVKHVTKKNKFTQFKDELCSVIDKDLLYSPSFLTFAFSGTLAVMSFLVPFVYISDLMPGDIYTVHERSLPLLFIGGFNIAFRIICGFISDHPKLSALQVSNFVIILAGISIAAMPFSTTLWHYILLCVPFSAGVACFAALRSVICVELVGVKKLGNAFGILMVFMGFGAVSGPAIAGQIKAASGNLNLAFYIMGGVFTFSAIMTLRLAQMKAWEESRKAKKARGTEMRVMANH